MTYYRKYRPQSLDDLIGQDHIKEALQKAHLSGNLSHAYLFSGPKGTGKTSTARILAKMVNCEAQLTDYRLQTTAEVGSRKSEVSQIPCNSCNTCLSITDGSNLDLIEIDAASNRGIDDIRDLRERIKLSPTNSRKKIYIIDEAHMLTTEAFNALLKTLEEPPEHVLFIMATTEPHKIPATILSRVQKFDFKAASEIDIIKNLKKIADSEKLKIEDGSLELIAKKGEGSFRDSLKILDQLASSSTEISTAFIEENLKSGTTTDSIELLEALGNKDVKKALAIIEIQVGKGVNIKEFTNLLIDSLRTLMLVIHTQNPKAPAVLLELSQKLNNLDTPRILNLLLESLEKLKYSHIPSLPLEIAVVESCSENKNTQVIPSVQNDNVVTQSIKESIPVRTNLDRIMNPQNVVPKISPIIISKPSTDDDVVYDSVGLQTILDKWTYILETVKPYNYSLEALLKQAKVVSVEEHLVCLEVPYSFHQRILEAPKSRSMLESIFADILGREVKVNCVLGNRPVRVEELANVELAADDEIVRVASEIFNS